MGGRWSKKRFRKAKCPIVERLTCRIMRHTFELIHLMTEENPIQVVVDAVSRSGAREASFRSIKSIAECLADELVNAAKGSSNSYAIKKKDELERVAKSNR